MFNRFAFCSLGLLGVLLMSQTSEGVAAAGHAGSADFYVATNGRDNWSGRLAAPNRAGTDGPFATIAHAQQAAREARPTGAKPRPLTVLIRGGTYRLTEPLVFTPEDSGSEAAPITYAAYPGEKPVISGGSPIAGWQKGEGELWIARIPEVQAGKWYFQQLFVNGQRRTRARTPNEGYFPMEGPLPEIKNPQADRDNPASRIGFTFRGGDLKSWPGLDDVNLIVFHAWTASVHWIKELDEQTHTVRFTAPSGWPVGYFERNSRYYVENHREALDSPGEWYLDRTTGVLTYWPLPGEDMKKAQVIAPVLQHLVRLLGEPDAGLPVEHLAFRGLSFQHTEWVVPDKGPADGQAATHLSAPVYARGARKCVFEGCEIAHVGEYGLWLAQGCQDNRVVRCEIHDLGGGGVKIGETESPANEARAADRNVVDNCYIHDGGHMFHAGIGVWIGRCSYNQVTHNEICDFDYSGMSIGWSWGYAASSANHNIAEYNHIHHIGRGVLSDMGGIYTLDVSPGTRLCHNLIHDIESYSYGGWGLYTDEGSTEILLENNVVYNTKTGGFHQHYGKENTLRNNIFAFSREPQIIRSREEEHSSFTFERNIVYCHNGLILGGNWGNGHYRLDSNDYWDLLDPDIELAGMSFAEWQAAGRDQPSLVADPKFVDAAKRDFRLKPDSPALKLGFQPIYTSKVGLYGEPEWVKKPQQVARKAIEMPLPTPPKPIDEGFETTPVGQPAAGATTSGEEGGASIRVSEEQAASGKQSLKFTDAPGLSREWQPHTYYYTSFVKGTARMSFDVWLGEGAIFWNEWRDAAGPYNAGPSVRIEQSGELRAGGRTLMTVPREQWVHLDFTCGLGKQTTGAYDLTVTVAGQEPRKFEKLPFVSDKFRKLQWIGFISLATEKTVFYLDNLKVEVTGNR
jgi:parallel beta-helix repeat protein